MGLRQDISNFADQLYCEGAGYLAGLGSFAMKPWVFIPTTLLCMGLYSLYQEGAFEPLVASVEEIASETLEGRIGE